MSDIPPKIPAERSEGYLGIDEVLLLKLFIQQNEQAIRKGEIDKLKVYQYMKKRSSIKNPYYVEVGNHIVELHLSHSVIFDISDGQNIRPFVLYETLGKGTFAKGKRGEYLDLENPGKPGVKGVAKIQKFFEPMDRKIYERELKGQKKVGGWLGQVIRPITSVTSTTRSRQNPRGEPKPVSIGYTIVVDAGIDLKRYLDERRKTGTLTGEELFNIGLGVLEDLFLRFHRRNIIHRDLKPSNLTIDLHTGKPKIIDVATWLNLNRVKKFKQNYFNFDGIETYVPMGRPIQRLVGTAFNMAPEIAPTLLNEQGEDRVMDYSKPWAYRYSKKTDIFALGVTLKDQFNLQDPKFWEDPPELSLLQKELAAFLERMTSPIPIERPSVEEVLLKLYEIRQKRQEISGITASVPNIPPQILIESLKLEEIKSRLSFVLYIYQQEHNKFIEGSKKRDEDTSLSVTFDSSGIKTTPKVETYAVQFLHRLTEIEQLLDHSKLPPKKINKLKMEIETYRKGLFNVHHLLKGEVDLSETSKESTTDKERSLYLSEFETGSAHSKIKTKLTPSPKDSSSSSSKMPPPSA